MAVDTPDQGIKTEGEQDKFLGSYADKTAAEAGLLEKDKTISRQANDLNQARTELDRFRTEVVERLAAQQVTQDAAPEVTVDDMVTSMTDALERGDKEGASEILRVMSAYVSDVEQGSEKKIQEGLDALTERFSGQITDIEKVIRDQSPEWLSYKDAVKDIADAAGIEVDDSNREMLLNLAKSQNRTDHPERADLPGGSTSTRVVANDGGPAVSEAAKGLLRGTVVGEITADEEAALKEMAKQRAQGRKQF